MLNSVEDESDRVLLESTLRNLERNSFNLFSVVEVGMAAMKLSANKCVGVDLIPGEVFIHAPSFLLQWLTNYVNSAFSHLYLPYAITDIMIRHVVKCHSKSPTESGNYRPIAIANSASKVIEELLLQKLEGYIQTSHNQFGFKPKHSTDMCILALKDTIDYYRTLKTPVFACFLDIKSAYDRVSHSRLFLKLIERGVPFNVIMLLRFWYSHQRLTVEWGTASSDMLPRAVGILRSGASPGWRMGVAFGPWTKYPRLPCVVGR